MIMKPLIMRFSPSSGYFILGSGYFILGSSIFKAETSLTKESKLVTIINSVKSAFLTFVKFLEII
jgi:hypothetical protein